MTKKRFLEDINANQSNEVGKKFLIISISITVFLNGSVAIWFLWYINKYGIDKFVN